MNDTPLTDAHYQIDKTSVKNGDIEFARSLERDLATWLANAKECDLCRIKAEQERDELRKFKADAIKNTKELNE
jgi:hypothetical protein